MLDTRKFEVIKKGSSYTLPKYEVVDGKGLVETGETQTIDFVKGNIEGPEFKQDGIITENLLSMLVEHLGELNVGDLRNRHTSVAITKLEEALFWIEERKRDRDKRSVLGTYKK